MLERESVCDRERVLEGVCVGERERECVLESVLECVLEREGVCYRECVRVR